MGTTGTPYNLRWPEDGDVADVPQDMQELAEDVETALDAKLNTATAVSNYQPKILVATTLPSSPVANQIVFLVNSTTI